MDRDNSSKRLPRNAMQPHLVAMVMVALAVPIMAGCGSGVSSTPGLRTSQVSIKGDVRTIGADQDERVVLVLSVTNTSNGPIWVSPALRDPIPKVATPVEELQGYAEDNTQAAQEYLVDLLDKYHFQAQTGAEDKDWRDVNYLDWRRESEAEAAGQEPSMLDVASAMQLSKTVELAPGQEVHYRVTLFQRANMFSLLQAAASPPRQARVRISNQSGHDHPDDLILDLPVDRLKAWQGGQNTNPATSQVPPTGSNSYHPSVLVMRTILSGDDVDHDLLSRIASSADQAKSICDALRSTLAAITVQAAGGLLQT